MEEELGNPQKCCKILASGLLYNKLEGSLFLKKMKVEEKLGMYDEVRKSLATLRHVSIWDSWKLIMEGALFEGRLGNV